MVKVGVIVKNDAGEIDFERSMFSLSTRGKTGPGGGFGFIRFANSRFGDTRTHGGIYRKKYTGYNQYGYSPIRKRNTIFQRMRYYRPTNPRTVEQQSNRNKFAEAVAAWPLLTDEQKTYYNERGKRMNKSGRNLFISWYMKQN